MKRGAYKKALKWLHMRAKLFGYLRQRLSFLFAVVGRTSKELVNRKCEGTRFDNEPPSWPPAPGRLGLPREEAKRLAFLIIFPRFLAFC